MGNIVYINTNDFVPSKIQDSLLLARESAVESLHNKSDALVTIMIQAYNRIDKTKKCIESVLENTKGIDYELLLIDNGSIDGTIEYFKSLDFYNKKIIRISKNIGSGFPAINLSQNMIRKYLVTLPNDVIVTPNWLENIIICMESDPKIGMVNAMSSNVSNLQECQIQYSDHEEMMKKTKIFNSSDPSKWEERIRLITLGTVYRKEVIMAKGLPLSDIGFFHDFSDDDISFQIRRLGYRLILAGDTWICHDHDFRNGEDKNVEKFKDSLKKGRENFNEKYNGIDAWNDTDYSYYNLINNLFILNPENPKFILGIDTKCGQPILDVKNSLRKNGIFDIHLSAFTQEAKYFTDLQSICDGNVICERPDVLRDLFVQNSFDYIVIGQAINQYSEPWQLINQAYSLLREGGYIILRIKNAFSFREYINMLGIRKQYCNEYIYNIPLEAIVEDLKKRGEVLYQQCLNDNINQNEMEFIKKIWNPTKLTNEDSLVTFSRLMASDYIIIAQKGRL